MQDSPPDVTATGPSLPIQSSAATERGFANGTSAYGVITASVGLSDGDHLQGYSYTIGEFTDFLTFTGTSDRLRISIDYSLTGEVLAAFYPRGNLNLDLGGLSSYSAILIEALPAAGLTAINPDYCYAQACVQQGPISFGGPEIVALDRSFTFEINNGATILLLGDLGLGADQYPATEDNIGGGELGALEADFSSGLVVNRFRGDTLTGVRSAALGDLFGIENRQGQFLYAGSAVPEPASWLMLITGFGLVGAMARRRAGAAVTA